MLVVGIGYPVALLRQALGPRCRDLTPTVTAAMRDGAGAVLPSGGAAAFLAFVVDELQPWVASRFPVGTDAVYAGHSLGGLFGAFTMFERPATFRGYASGEPVDLVGRPRGAAAGGERTRRATTTSRRRSS